MIDYAKNTVFLDEETKQRVNREIQSSIDMVQHELENRDFNTNGYFIGSISRKEPATLIASSNKLLFSDMDFLIVVEEKDYCNEFFNTITGFFKSKVPEIKWSFIVIEKSKINNINSHMRKDLEKVIETPLWESFNVEKLEIKQLSKMQIIESAINAIACLYLHPNLWGGKDSSVYREQSYYKVKAALECIRAIFIDKGIEVRGFFDLYLNRFDKRIENLVSPKYIEELIKERELFCIEKEKKWCVGDIFVKMINNHFDTHEAEELKKILLNYGEADIVDSFQKALISLVMAFNTDEKEKRIFWFNTISYIVSSMKKGKAKYLEKYVFLAKLRWNTELVSDISFMTEVIKAMYFFRFDYYHNLFYQNTGTYRIPDLRKI